MKEVMWIICRSEWDGKDTNFVIKNWMATGNLILDKEVTEVTKVEQQFRISAKIKLWLQNLYEKDPPCYYSKPKGTES